jgi:hypothetical protein
MMPPRLRKRHGFDARAGLWIAMSMLQSNRLTMPQCNCHGLPRAFLNAIAPSPIGRG